MSRQNASGRLEDIAQIGGIELAPATEGIEPFRVTMHQAALDDLKRRLAQTRWPNAQTVRDWSQGVPLAQSVLLERGGPRRPLRRVGAACTLHR
jgi:epoxide hydrolase-like protein